MIVIVKVAVVVVVAVKAVMGIVVMMINNKIKNHRQREFPIFSGKK